MPRTRFLTNGNLHVVVQRRQERHKPLHREAIELVVLQGRYLGLVHLKQRGRSRLGVAAFLKNLIDGVGEP